MKAVILAGGLGTRLSEETSVKPKPMVEIGGMPILWHIMKIYSSHGITDFIICCGYKGYLIKEYFSNYSLHASDVTIDYVKNQVTYHETAVEPWRVTMIDTGDFTETGGRLLRIREHLDNEDFCFTYGDGVADINITDVVRFHTKRERLSTVVGVVPPGRYGAIEQSDGLVQTFLEKPPGDGALINGGFFVLSPRVLDYISGDATVWEKEPMVNLAHDGEMAVYKHEGFWQSMDTLREKQLLNQLWDSDQAKWKTWL